MRARDLAQGVFWIAVSLAMCWGQFLLSAKRRRAINGGGIARGRVVEIILHGRRRDFRPVIEFAASDGERVTFEDVTRVGEYDHGREFEVAYDPADPWGTAVAVRENRWFWSRVGGVLITMVIFIVGIMCLVQGITGD
jgi:Protein of unknown function (DUF3592)